MNNCNRRRGLLCPCRVKTRTHLLDPYASFRRLRTFRRNGLCARSAMSRHFRLAGVTEYWIGTAASLRLDVGRPDHLAPLFGFLGDHLAEVSGREREHVAAQVGKARLDLGIGKASVDLLVELLDYLGRRGLRCAESGARGCRTRRQRWPERSRAPAATDRLARKQSETWPAARPRPRPDAEIGGGEVSRRTSLHVIRSPRRRGRAASAAPQGRAPWRLSG